MTVPGARPARKAVLIDLGGVLLPDYLSAAAIAWSTRLGLTQQAFLGALFGGSDDQVLTGQVSEPAWWDIVAARLGAGPGLLAELRADLASREVWDEALAALLRRLRGHVKTAIVSNAWPEARARIAEAGKLDIADEIVLSCEAGYAKPDPRLGIKTVQDRLYRGPCITPTDMAAVVAKFTAQKAAIKALYARLPLDDGYRRRALDYQDEFFRMIADPRQVKRELIETCAGGA